MSRTWRFAPHDSARIAQIQRELRCSALLSSVLSARGFQSAADARAFLNSPIADLHEPSLLPGLDEAVHRLTAAIQAGRRITVYGDYDADGVTATSILWHCLKLAGALVDYYIPSRLDEGYGLNADAVRSLHESDPHRLLVTVDCGIASTAEASLARELGLELIITDHHTFGPSLPEACLVHPRLPGSMYPFADLCGAGVAFKLAWGVCQKLGDGRKASSAMREFLKSAVGLAALGTVADVVPLLGENRILVRYGLTTLPQRLSPGLAALLELAGHKSGQPLSAEDLAFGLAPRINAAGRLGQARLAVELLTTSDPDRAQQLATYVDELNKNRQTVERKIFKRAKELVTENGWQESAALVLASDDWHPGVIGIVAGRIAEHFSRPAILFSLPSDSTSSLAQGSGRAGGPCDLHQAVTAASSHLASFGGHMAAVGLKISPDRIHEFRETFVAHVEQTRHLSSPNSTLAVDAEVSLEDLTPRSVDELEQLGPFGSQHPRPIFVAAGVELAEPPQKMGGGEQHLALKLRQFRRVLRAVAFGRANWADELAKLSGPLSVCFSPVINRFRGYENVELQLLDWRPDSADSPAPPLATAAAGGS